MGNNVTQKISKVDNGKIVQVGGDVNYSMTINSTTADTQLIKEVHEVCDTIVKKELETYTAQAYKVAQSYIKGYIDSILDRMEQLEEDVRKKLQQPAVQVSLRHSILGGLQMEDEDIKDENIGIMMTALRLNNTLHTDL